jgi:hypothetical protein
MTVWSRRSVIAGAGAARYHVREAATKEPMKIITAGLVRNQDVALDCWIQPVTGLVHSVEFSTDPMSANGSEEQVDSVLEVDQYGDKFTIVLPDELRTG